MKKLWIITGIAGLLLSSVVTAQIKVPQKAQAAFSKAFPGVHPKWEKEDGNFEGNWKEGDRDHAALFTPQGKCVSSETEIELKELPQTTKSYLAKHKIVGIKEVTRNADSNGLITYEADKENKSYIFDDKGAFLKMGAGD